MWHRLKTRPADDEDRTEHGCWRSTGIGIDRVKPPRFDESTSWVVFHCQFEAMVGPCEKVTHLLITLQGQAADVLHSILTEATYREIIGATTWPQNTALS
jgi:hypothetical protein